MVWISTHPEFYLKNEVGEIIDPIDPSTGEPFGWTDVADLDYDNKEMQEQMRQAMLYWVRECNVDGYRIDQAYAVPQEFYDITFAALKEIKPLFLLAETDVNHIGGIAFVAANTSLKSTVKISPTLRARLSFENRPP